MVTTHHTAFGGRLGGHCESATGLPCELVRRRHMLQSNPGTHGHALGAGIAPENVTLSRTKVADVSCIHFSTLSTLKEMQQAKREQDGNGDGRSNDDRCGDNDAVKAACRRYSEVGL